MAELNLRINTQQAAQAGKAFERILNDIKQAARTLDNMNMAAFGATFRSLTSSGANLLAMVNQIADALGRVNYTLQSLRAADFGGKIAADFGQLRNIFREMRGDIQGVSSGLRDLATQATRAATTATRVRTTRAAPPPAQEVQEQTTRALVVQQTQYLTMAQERARMIAQVSAQEAQARQTEMQAQQEMLGQVSAFQQARVAAANATAAAEELAAQQSMHARIAAERAAQAAFQETQAVRSQQIAEVAALQDAARQREIQAEGAALLSFRAFQQARVRAVEEAARQEEMAIQRTLQTRLKAAEQWRVVGQQQLALPPGRTDSQTQAFWAARQFEESQRVRRIQIPERAGPSAYGESAFGGGATEGARRVFGGFEEVNRTLEKTGKGLEDTKAKKDRLDKNLKDTANNTLPGFTRAWLQVITTMALFEARRLFQELTQLGKTLFELGRDAENTFAIFKAGARNDIDEATRRMLVASDVAKRFGLDLNQTEQDYARLSAAAMGTTLEGARLEKVFLGIAQAQAVLGQNTEKGTGLIKVFTDMLGKGRVQSEELVKQMGNVIPGSVRLVADAMGMTTTALTSAIARGRVTVEEVLTKVGEEFARRFGPEAENAAKRLGNAFNIVKTSFIELGRLVVSSGFADALKSAFDRLRAFLEDAATRQAILQLANFITNVLGKAFEGLIKILEFLRDNLRLVIGAFAVLTSAAMVAGVIALARALNMVLTVILGLGTGGIGAVIRIAALVGTIGASLWAGAEAANAFDKSLEGIPEKLKKWDEELARLREQEAKGQGGESPITRAVQEALDTIERETRTFAEELRGQAQLADLARSGVSTLSSQFEAYAKVLERVRSLERADVFAGLGTARADEMRARFIDAMLVAERAKQIMDDLLAMYKALDQERIKTDDARLTLTANLQAFQEGGFTPLSARLQEDYDRRVLPVLRRVKEQLADLTDPRQIRALSEGFNQWNVQMRDSVVQMTRIQSTMDLLTDITEELTELTRGRQRLDLFAGVRDSAEMVTRSVGEHSEELKRVMAEGIPDLKPPKLRTLGEDMQKGFNPAATGKEMGQSFTAVFADALEKSMRVMVDEMDRVVKAINQANAQAALGTTGMTGKGTGPALAQSGQYRGLFEKVGETYKVDPEFLARIARSESGFDPRAVGHDAAGNIVKGGGQGIGQFIPSTWKRYGQGRDPFDAEANVDAMGRYVADLLKQYNGDLERALTAYRGKSREQDPKYFERILGGYTPAQGAQAAATPAAQPAAAPPPPVSPTATDLGAATGGVLGRRGFLEGVADWFRAKPAAAESNVSAFGGMGGPQLVSALGWLKNQFMGSDYTAAPQTRYVPGEAPAAIAKEEAITRPAQAVAGLEAEEAEHARKTIDAMREKAALTQKQIELNEQQRRQSEANAKAAEAEAEKTRQRAAEMEKAIAGVEKEIAQKVNLGDIMASDLTHREAERAGLELYWQAVEKYGPVAEQFAKRLVEIGKAREYLKRIEDSSRATRAVGAETAAIQEETKLIGANFLTREAMLDQQRRLREAARTETFTPESWQQRVSAEQGRTRAAIGQNVAGYLDNLNKENRALELNTQMLSVNADEREATAEAQQELNEVMRHAGDLQEKDIQQIREAIERRRQLRLEYQRLNGPLKQYIDSLANLSTESGVSNAIQQRTVELFSNLEDEIVNFTKTGKFNFKDFADSFIESIQRMVLQAMIFRPIMEALNQAMSGKASQGAGAGAGAGGGGGGGWLATLLGVAQTAASAYSGNYAGAAASAVNLSASEIAATGGYVTSRGIEGPQMFAGGGVVPGSDAPLNTFQGGGMQGIGSDTVPAILTPGEVVLNRAQQEEIVGQMGGTQNNTFNMVFPNVSNQDQARQTAAQAYSEVSSRLERQRVRDGVRHRK